VGVLVICGVVWEAHRCDNLARHYNQGFQLHLQMLVLFKRYKERLAKSVLFFANEKHSHMEIIDQLPPVMILLFVIQHLFQGFLCALCECSVKL